MRSVCHSNSRTRRSCVFESLENRNLLTYLSQIGGTDSDVASDAAVDADGYTYIGGNFQGTSDFDPGPGTYSMTSEHPTAFVAKYDPHGELVWARAFDIEGKRRGLNIPRAGTHGIAVDGSGGVYAIGSFNFSVDFTGTSSFVTSAGDNDIFITKLDASTGETDWARTLGGNDADLGIGIDEADGYVYATGLFSGTVDFDPGIGNKEITATESPDDAWDGFVLKLDTAGQYDTAWNFGGSRRDRGDKILIEGNTVFVGGSFETAADFDPTANEVIRTSVNGFEHFFASYSTSGLLNWVQSIGNEESYSDPRIASMAVDETNLVIAGYFRGAFDVDPSSSVLNLTSAGTETGFVAKYSKNTGLLDPLFEPRQFGGSTDNDEVRLGGMTLDSSGAIHIGVSYEGSIDVDPGPEIVSPPAAPNDGPRNSVLLKLAADGSYLNYWHGSGYGTNPVRVIDDAIFTVGNFRGTATFPTGDTLVSYGGDDIYLLSITTSEPPTANAGLDVAGTEDQSVTFDGSGSNDPEGDPLTYVWDFGDGNNIETSNPVVSHTYAHGGSFPVNLTVLDGSGNNATDTVMALVSEVNDTPIAEASGPYTGVAGQSVVLDASASSDFDNLDATAANDQVLEYTWDFGDGTPPIVTSDATSDHTYAAVGQYTVTLTVSDGVATSAPAVTTAAIQEAPVGDTKDIYVWDIADAFETRQRGRNTDYRVVLTVRNDSDGDGIAELSDDVVANVDVVVELRDANGNLITTLTGTTDTDWRV